MTKKAQKPKRDIYGEVTANIIKAIEADPDKVTMPWQRSGMPIGLPCNVESDNAYNGINVVNLWVTAEIHGFSTGIWGTYRQWSEKGAQVRKGEKSSLVIFYKEFRINADVEPDLDQSNGIDDGKRRVARASYVFNADQVEGFEPDPLPHNDPVERINSVDRFVTSTKAEISHGGDRAYYRNSSDHIQIPDESRFIETENGTRTEGYYAVLLHELTHWTSDKRRCDRQLGKRFGDNAYAMEELIAELGAAFLCAELSITSEPRPGHASYIANWLSILKSDNRAIFTASAKANQAVTYLKSLQAKLSSAKTNNGEVQ